MAYCASALWPCSPFFEQLRLERLAVGHLLCQCGFEFGAALGGLLGRDLSIASSLLVRAFQGRRGVGQLCFDLRRLSRRLPSTALQPAVGSRPAADARTRFLIGADSVRARRAVSCSASCLTTACVFAVSRASEASNSACCCRGSFGGRLSVVGGLSLGALQSAGGIGELDLQCLSAAASWV